MLKYILERAASLTQNPSLLGNPEVTKLRIAIFEILDSQISRDKDSIGSQQQWGPSKGLRHLYEENLRCQGDEIINLLQGSVNYTLGPNIVKKIRGIVQKAAELALDIGLQSREITTYKPELQGTVTIGDRFHHFRNGGERDRGAELMVELVQRPGLQQVSDGRDGQSSIQVLVPALIYPRNARR
jgi:hypothetical protein